LLGSVAEGTVAIASVLIGAVLRSSPGAIVVLSNAIGVVFELGLSLTWAISRTPVATNAKIKKIAGPRALFCADFCAFFLRRFFALDRAVTTVQLWQV
jgi:hypothetical protein